MTPSWVVKLRSTDGSAMFATACWTEDEARREVGRRNYERRTDAYFYELRSAR